MPPRASARSTSARASGLRRSRLGDITSATAGRAPKTSRARRLSELPPNWPYRHCCPAWNGSPDCGTAWRIPCSNRSREPASTARAGIASPTPATYTSTESTARLWSSPSICAASPFPPGPPALPERSRLRTSLPASAFPATGPVPACAFPWDAPTPPNRWTPSPAPSWNPSRTCAESRSMPETPIAVAMSGGVDSSVVAALLARQGRNVVGLTMQLWNQRRLPELSTANATGRCCSLDDVYDARRVAEQVGIPYYVVNFEQQFEQQVVKPFVEEYLAGRTPVPCTLCNNYIKFDRFLEMADAVGAHHIATGAYARIRYDEANGRYHRLRAVDGSKDQTYFLFGLTQQQLARTLFPPGELTKPEVRDLARGIDLAVANKGD